MYVVTQARRVNLLMYVVTQARKLILLMCVGTQARKDNYVVTYVCVCGHTSTKS